MNNVLGIRSRLNSGYIGGAQIRTTAMERGELQGACRGSVSLGAQFPEQLAGGQLKVILQMGLSRHPDYKDVRCARTRDRRQWSAALELLFAQLALGRPLLGPPECRPRRRAAEGFQQHDDDTPRRPAWSSGGLGGSRMKDVMERIRAQGRATTSETFSTSAAAKNKPPPPVVLLESRLGAFHLRRRRRVDILHELLHRRARSISICNLLASARNAGSIVASNAAQYASTRSCGTSGGKRRDSQFELAEDDVQRLPVSSHFSRSPRPW